MILNIKNIKTTYLNKLLDYKNLGLYKIIRVINNRAYKLDLLALIRGIFLVFYLLLLYLNKSDLLPR